MSLYYAWGWDTARTGSLGFRCSDSAGGTVPDEIIGLPLTLPSGTYSHVTLSSVLSGYDELAAAVVATGDSLLATNGFGTVTFSASTLAYTIDTNASDPIDFTRATLGDERGNRLAAALGFNHLHPNATGGSASDPYDITLDMAAARTSNARPVYLIIPAIQGRSELTDEIEPEEIAADSLSEDGEMDQIAIETSSVWIDWQQVFEPDEVPSDPFGPGTPVFERTADAIVPWSYQHAFRHTRDGKQPFLVVDGAEESVHEMRGDGVSFRPVRAAAKDYSLWSVAFRTRLVGRL